MQNLNSRELSPARQKLAVLSLALGSFASVTTEFLPVGILPDISRTFSVSPGTAGLTMTVPGMMAALSAPGVMLFSGRTDRRRMILWLSLILLAGCHCSRFKCWRRDSRSFRIESKFLDERFDCHFERLLSGDP